MPNHPVILNSTNKVSNAKYEYIFPSTQKFTAGTKVSLNSISMYNSIFNVEAVRSNNKISIIWNANTSVQYDLTVSDGFYDISSLNFQIQSFCILNDLYMINDATGEYVYYINLLTNSTAYSAQLNIYPLPTTAEATALGYSIPVGASWTAPVSAKTPQLIIPVGTFGNLIGFQSATYPSAIQSTFQAILSTTTPQISPVNSILIGCNLINSAYANPSHIFASIPIKAGFGSLIDYESASPVATSISSGSYGKITIEFYSQFFELLRLHDDEVTIILNIHTPDE